MTNAIRQPDSPAPPARRFRLVRYFVLASAGMFALVAMALVYFQLSQSEFFQRVQNQQGLFFHGVQSDFATRQDAAARRDLLAVHEAGNVNLTRLFANSLWQLDFAPYVARAQDIGVDHCRSIADVADPASGKRAAPPEKKACFAEVGRQFAAFKDFAALNAKVFDVMRSSTVFKIKVFDLRGITVYSSEAAQMGEDKSGNAGWRGAAVDGKATSELTFRDRFSAFEGVVEKRDLISSYIPVRSSGSDSIVGVFEVYSDVTPFLDQIKQTSASLRQAAAANQVRLQASADEQQVQVENTGRTTLAIVLGLMLALFAALFLIVRHADGILAQQARERERAHQQLSQAEKLASLGQMVAGVAHQLNTPLAFSHNNVTMAVDALRRYERPLKLAGRFSTLLKSANSDRVTLDVSKTRSQVADIDEQELDVAMPIEMLGDTLQGIAQMRELVDNLRDFTRLDRSKSAAVDVNKGLRSVVYMARSVIPTRICIVERLAELPALVCNVSQLNQVFLNLINNAAQAIPGDGTITVQSAVEGGQVRVDIIDTGTGIAPEVLPHVFDDYFTTKPAGEGTGLGLPIARSIAREHGGDISVATAPGAGSTFTVWLPLPVALRQAA
jgi:two-component system NtrC family sensor kinase